MILEKRAVKGTQGGGGGGGGGGWRLRDLLGHRGVWKIEKFCYLYSLEVEMEALLFFRRNLVVQGRQFVTEAATFLVMEKRIAKKPR